MDWFNDKAWLVWLGLAVILGSVEMVTLDLLFLMLAGGALFGALSAILGAPLLVQAIVALAASVSMVGFVRPIALRHLRQAPEARTGIDALIGQQALVINRVDAHDGRVKLAGEVWSARSYDPQTVLPPGSTVDVLAIEGATAVVHASHL